MLGGGGRVLRTRNTAGKLGLVETAAKFQGARQCVGGKKMEPADLGQEGRLREDEQARGDKRLRL